MRVHIASRQSADEVLIREAVASLGYVVCDLRRFESLDLVSESLRQFDLDLVVLDAALDSQAVATFLTTIVENFSASGIPILVLGTRSQLNELAEIVRRANVETFCRNEEDSRHLQRAIITVLEKAAAHRAFEARYRFERIITTVASRFINLPPHQLNSRLDGALELVGKFARVDRAFIILYEARDHTVRMTHEWYAEGIDSARAYYASMPFPDREWPIELLRRGETVAISRREHLPPHASKIQRILEDRGLLSFALVPLLEEERFIGVLGLSTIREARSWTREDISLMKVVGEIFVSAVRQGKLESALEESEVRYKTLIDALGEGIIFTDREDIILHINSRLAEMTGYTASELVGRHSYDVLVSNDDRERLQAHTARRLQGLSETYEIKLRRKDGSLFWAEINATPIPNPMGDIVATLGAVTDIHERRIAQEALAHQRTFLTEVINSNPNIVFVKNAEGRITLANQALANLYKLELDEIIGQSEANLISDVKLLERYRREDELVMGTGERIVLPEGSFWDPIRNEERWFQTIKARMTNEHGEPAVLIVANEITERKRAEAAAFALQRQLLQAQKMEAIGQLAAGLAHDLNNSLAAVVGHLQLMALDQSLSEQVRRSLHVALGGCERASSLIERLLGFSRQGRYNLKTVSLRKIAEDTVAFVERIIGSDIRLTWSGLSDDLYVHADEGQLQQVVTNLIINARHAMPKGGDISFEFSVREIDRPDHYNPKARSGKYVCLSVIDSGSGIPPENLDKIFEPFFTTKADASGTGLGLAMVYGILQHHGGWVSVSSEVGKGSRFSLFLPQMQAPPTQRAMTVRENAVDSGRACILVIDDERALVELTSQFLQLAGYEPVGFTEAEQALHWFSSHHSQVDLTIMDMKMPRVTGSQLFKELRTIDPEAQVTVLSGYIHDESAQQLISDGALRFFQKPLQYPELVEWINGLLRFRQKQKGARIA